MDRRTALKLLGTGCLPFITGFSGKSFLRNYSELIKSSDFGNFTWGVASSAFQTEGGWNIDGKGNSIWDTFTHRKGIVKDGSNADDACDSYHHYKEDVALIKKLGFSANRFSISWPRIMPEGKGQVNMKGIDFYSKVIDQSLEKDIEPWVTLYHWDLPQSLEDKGGWVNRDVTGWFSDYTAICAKYFGDRVKNWIVLNEPMGFIGLGYGLGIHAPGLKGFKHFLPAVHHAALCQAEGGRVLRNLVKTAKIGTAFSCSPVDPIQHSSLDDNAARRIDALMNRLFIEPSLGLGYPMNDLHFLKRIEKYFRQGDEQLLEFDFDFIGLQNYFRIVTDFSPFVPLLWAKQESPKKRSSILTDMDWEVYPEGIYRSLKQFSKYKIKEIVVTENGAAFNDIVENGTINDIQRINFFRDYLSYILKAKKEGVNVTGYFVWSLLDNFEWIEGFRPRFGIVYVDYQNQTRIVKNSGKWFSEFLSN
jgi:beta-glucosidase